MTALINASTSSGLITTADTSGQLALQSNGTTQLTVSSTGVAAANTFQMNSGYGSAATAYGCRAWVNFDGTGTPTIRNSGNVTSISDIGVGVFDVNLTVAMPDTNYACLATSGQTGGNIAVAPNTASLTPTTSVFRVSNTNAAGTNTDPQTISVAVLR